MASLQFVIDSICSKLTPESMYQIIKVQLCQGPCKVADIIPMVRKEDRSLDYDSAKMLADAAFEALAERGEVRIEGDSVLPAGQSENASDMRPSS